MAEKLGSMSDLNLRYLPPAWLYVLSEPSEAVLILGLVVPVALIVLSTVGKSSSQSA